MNASKMRVAIIPGNGAGNIEHCNWYGWARRNLSKLPGVEAVLRNMPDPVLARESIWLPFMERELGCGPNCIIIGHSSGAAAAMRFAERHEVKGLVLVSAYTTDQGDATERASGYFSRPWDWQAIKKNAGFIVQFGSRDDPFLPWEEQQEVAQALDTELHEYQDQGHFQDEEFPDLLSTLRTKLEGLLEGQG